MKLCFKGLCNKCKTTETGGFFVACVVIAI